VAQELAKPRKSELPSTDAHHPRPPRLCENGEICLIIAPVRRLPLPIYPAGPIVAERWVPLQAARLGTLRTALRNTIALALFAVAEAASGGERLEGHVIAVHDGDTITVLDREHIQHRVRLGGIDAPEKGQRYSRAARNELARRVFERWVRVEWNKIDAYGRLIGKVTQAGQDAGRDQLAAGMAWWLRPFAYEQSLADQQEYADVEARAREQRRGLWRDRNPVPPWVWRRKHPDRSRSRATQPDRGTSAPVVHATGATRVLPRSLRNRSCAAAILLLFFWETNANHLFF